MCLCDNHSSSAGTYSKFYRVAYVLPKPPSRIRDKLEEWVVHSANIYNLDKYRMHKKTYHSDSRVALDGPFDNLGMPAPLPQPGHLGPTCNDSLETHYNQQRNRSAPFLTIMATHIAGRTHPVRIAAQNRFSHATAVRGHTEGKRCNPKRRYFGSVRASFLRDEVAWEPRTSGKALYVQTSSGSFPE